MIYVSRIRGVEGIYTSLIGLMFYIPVLSWMIPPVLVMALPPPPDPGTIAITSSLIIVQIPTGGLGPFILYLVVGVLGRDRTAVQRFRGACSTIELRGRYPTLYIRRILSTINTAASAGVFFC